MATGYERNLDSYLRRIATSLEGLERALTDLVDLIVAEVDSDDDECGEDDF